jgi:hypothetical protein
MGLIVGTLPIEQPVIVSTLDRPVLSIVLVLLSVILEVSRDVNVNISDSLGFVVLLLRGLSNRLICF